MPNTECICVLKDGERFAHGHCTAFHQQAAVGYVTDPQRLTVQRGHPLGEMDGPSLDAIHRLYVAALAARDHIANQHLHPGGIRQRLCNQLSEAISGVGHLFVQGAAVTIDRGRTPELPRCPDCGHSHLPTEACRWGEQLE